MSRLRFTKMHGAGNDFVVIDATTGSIELQDVQVRWLADRHFGIGADQVLLVETSTEPEVDFVYRIFNADGGEVEHCGNGARCFLKFVRDSGLTGKDRVKVRTLGGVIELVALADGRVCVDMGAPRFDESSLPFATDGLRPRIDGRARLWPLRLSTDTEPVWIQAVSMGNPHAVQFVDDVATAPVTREGALIEAHERFARRVNAGFVQRVARNAARVRVHERGVGETLACGTGVCAAVVSGIQRGLFDDEVDVQTRGGRLTIRWKGFMADSAEASVFMIGSAQTVFASEVDLPSVEQASSILLPAFCSRPSD